MVDLEALASKLLGALGILAVIASYHLFTTGITVFLYELVFNVNVIPRGVIIGSLIFWMLVAMLVTLGMFVSEKERK